MASVQAPGAPLANGFPASQQDAQQIFMVGRTPSSYIPSMH